MLQMRGAADGLIYGRVSTSNVLQAIFPPFYSLGSELEKNTAGCRAFNRIFIVGGQCYTKTE